MSIPPLDPVLGSPAGLLHPRKDLRLLPLPPFGVQEALLVSGLPHIVLLTLQHHHQCLSPLEYHQPTLVLHLPSHLLLPFQQVP